MIPKRWPIDQGKAAFSACDQYRWWLWRRWNFTCLREIAFIGLNPSTADAATDDPTVGRCIRRAMSLDYSGMWMLNAFAFRATDPREMMRAKDPVGKLNDRHITDVCALGQVHTVVLCWGGLGRVLNRSAQLLELLRPVEHKLRYLDITSSGEPRHPLYLPNKLELKQWTDNDTSRRGALGADRLGSSARSRRRPKSSPAA